jgi:surfeit locus 1 family protein
VSAPSPTYAGAGWRVLLQPRLLLLHAAAVLALVACVLLGRWQLHAWQLHREDQAAALADQSPVPLDDVLGPDDPYRNDAVGQPVEASGVWVPGSTTYVANRPAHRGDESRTGYWQLASLAVCPDGGCAGASAIPVVLGWTPEIPSGTAAPEGRVEVTGWLQPGEGSEVDDDPTDDVLPSVRIPDLLQRSHRDLYAGYVILDQPAGARDGLAPVTPDSLPEAPASAGLRNLLYAFQWWIFGGFAVFLWWRWCRDEMAARLPSEA